LKVKAPLAAVLVVRALFSSARVVLALTPGNPKSGGYERVVACGEADEWPKNPLEWIRRIVCRGRRGQREVVEVDQVDSKLLSATTVESDSHCCQLVTANDVITSNSHF
tara:strand:- start:27 stop:353 length:327 start_codon:yes stop_codon:yes gene_type:complete